MREKILKILEEIDCTVDYEKEKALIDDMILDSFGVLTLIGELEDEFDVRITTMELVPENMNSLDSITAMVERLQNSN